MSIEVNGKQLETAEEGYIQILADWSPEVGEVMAKEDECDLNENHWEVINFLRDYYDEYQVAPAVRVLTKAIGKKLGKDKGNTKPIASYTVPHVIHFLIPIRRRYACVFHYTQTRN